MELIINENRTICLNMIVKNESHIIEETLQKLCNKIKFDYWVISDTGSTDNTIEIIKNFFGRLNIRGEMYNDEWKGFDYNRSNALEYAFNKTDYLLIFDADDEIEGNLHLPENLIADAYNLTFGSPLGISYTRPLLINNRKKWKYESVIHEYLVGLEPNLQYVTLYGDYFVVSGRKGSRSMDPEKYLKDALILEEAFANAEKENNPIKLRYSFYCANSYFDYGKKDKAIEWYKKTLSLENWNQEKYFSCLRLAESYESLNNQETSMFYLVKSFTYDNERVEGIYKLIVHYCCENQNEIAFAYYQLIQNFYENNLDIVTLVNKLFVDQPNYTFLLPYYMIIVSERLKKYDIGLKMYEIIFKHKCKNINFTSISNLLFNLQFFIDKSDSSFQKKCKEYCIFLLENNMPIFNLHFIHIYEKYGLKMESHTKFSKHECRNSKKILFYTGICQPEWNLTHSLTNALGGSETAVAYLSKYFPSDYEIYVSGSVKEEIVDNVYYINISKLQLLLDNNAFHTIIVSRFIGFFENFVFSSFQNFIWAHDTCLLSHPAQISDIDILNKWTKSITGCVCLTEWHKLLFEEKYPVLSKKIHVINNGIKNELFLTHNTKKQKNLFIFTSCSERGLSRLLVLWEDIIKYYPDAELKISSYTDFPRNDEERKLQQVINSYPSVKHLGKLGPESLYNLMSSAEYWLYPSYWPETSCITALEMLKSGVICVYYPIAGLPETIQNHGFEIKEGNEMETFLNLSEYKKITTIQNGKKYVEECTWQNRCKLWNDLLFAPLINTNTTNTTNKWFFFAFPHHNEHILIDYIKSLNTKHNYNIEYTKDMDYILSSNPRKISYILDILNPTIYNKFMNTDTEISILNTEPLNMTVINLQKLMTSYSKYNNIKIYDYSLSNIKILKNNGITNTEYLGYAITDSENMNLSNLYLNSPKIYDFGIIIGCGGHVPDRRQIIIDELIQKGFTVHIISGWLEERDKQLSQCNIILNIHGSNYGETATIFEHIRCDRLLNAGFKILSEDSEYIEETNIPDFSNIKFIPYESFKNIELLNNDDLWNSINKFEIKPFSHKKVIDCFIFYNELELLNYRLNVLNDVVDYFVIVEATHTHVGNEKILYYQENKEMFEKFKHKIIHIIVDDFPFQNKNINLERNEQWVNEKFQRQCISRGIEQILLNFQLNDNDLITICDLDEILDPNTLLLMKNNQIKLENDIGMPELDNYYYNLNTKFFDKWDLTKIINYKYYKINKHCSNFIENVRQNRNCFRIPNGGWHLSYFGSPNFIKNKLANFAHCEFNNEQFNKIETIENKIKNGLDLFNRSLNPIIIPLKDNKYLPPLYNSLLKNFIKPTIVSENIVITNEILNNFQLINDEYLVNQTYYTSFSGVNEYRLYSYLSTFFNNTVILDIGTFDGRSAVALSHNETNHVISYNIQDDIKINNHKIYSKPNIEFRIKNVLDDLTEEFISKCKLIVLDIGHYGDDEKLILHRLNELKFSGIILLDDIIHPDPIIYKCMQEFWNNIEFKKIDLTKYGHISGTGCVLMNTSMRINQNCIGFHSNQLSERGTDVGLYDYAYYNQKLYGNKSIIFYCKNNPNNNTDVIRKFEQEFKCYAYTNFSEIDDIIVNEKINYFYNAKYGRSDDQLVRKCPNLIHAVFTVDPHGEKYATVSKQLSQKYNNSVEYVPYMIDLPFCKGDMREKLNIPTESIVMGRIGGIYQFDIAFAHDAIKTFLELDKDNTYFLFVNTNVFYQHPRIIYLDKIIDSIEKVTFINSCDAMIHARSDGETFGLAVGEFSSLNKPVITTRSSMDNSHLDILGEKAVLYNNTEELVYIFKDIRNIIAGREDWNAYKEYTPEIVMKKFMEVFL